MDGLPSTASGSATTTSSTPVVSRTGELHGVTGCRTLPTSLDRRNLQTPAEVDTSLKASLPPSVEFVSQGTYSIGEYGYDERVVLRVADTATKAEVAEAVALVEHSLRPCSAATLRRELARLRAVTISRAVGQENLDVVLAAYADELGRYPDDVVVAACRRRYRFWPALDELLDATEELAGPRKDMLAALKMKPMRRAEPVDYSETKRLVAERDARWAEAAAWRAAHPELCWPKAPPTAGEPVLRSVADCLPDTIAGEPWR